MTYTYETPQEAIISLEKAYTNKDLEAVIDSKDFATEAKLILEKKSYKITDEILKEVEELLKLSLIKSIEDNGYPNFEGARREFSELTEIRDGIFIIEEKIFYPNSECHINKIFLSNNDNLWKVAMIEE